MSAGRVGVRVSDVAPVLRVATAADLDVVAAVMRASVLELFPQFYDDRQTASAAVYVAHVDRTLVADGTYFVCVVGGEIVACGGWSRRGRLYTGSGDQDGDDRLLDPRSEAAHIRAMFVRPDWTRRGLGRAILQAGHDAARSEGFQRLDLVPPCRASPCTAPSASARSSRLPSLCPTASRLDAVAMERAVDPI